MRHYPSVTVVRSLPALLILDRCPRMPGEGLTGLPAQQVPDRSNTTAASVHLPAARHVSCIPRGDAGQRPGRHRLESLMTAATDPLDDLTRHLTENSLAFLHRSIAGMRDDSDARALAFAAVDLAVAVEVLLKARLVREHWTLICSDLDKVTPAQILAGTARTIEPTRSVTRLKNIAGVELPPERSAQLTRIGDLRNRVAHFALVGPDITAQSLQSPLARALDFVLWFLDTEFRDQDDHDDQGLKALVDESIDTLHTQIGALRLLVDERMSSIAEDLANAVLCVECARCGLPALMLLDGDNARCAYCLWRPSGEQCAQEYTEVVLGTSAYRVAKDGGRWPVHHCFECERESMVEGVESRTPSVPVMGIGDLWACFSCGDTVSNDDVDFCYRCDEPMRISSQEGIEICQNCIESMMADASDRSRDDFD